MRGKVYNEIIRNPGDSDGECFALFLNGKDCAVIKKKRRECGTYACPFYKPKEFFEWTRINENGHITLMSVEDFLKKYK